MFRCFGGFIEPRLKNYLYNQRNTLIDEAIDSFKSQCPNEQNGDLPDKLDLEANRVYAIVDKSVLRERIKRANVTVVAIFGFVLIATIIIGYPIDSPNSLIPILGAGINWAISILTIPISYNERVRGGLDTVVNSHISSLKKNQNAVPHEVSIVFHSYRFLEIKRSAHEVQLVIEKNESKANEEHSGFAQNKLVMWNLPKDFGVRIDPIKPAVNNTLIHLVNNG